MPLIQLVYKSVATRPMSSEDLEQIIASARHRNPDNGITGMLFFADGHFMQVLEGEEHQVDATLARVRLDTRHTDLIVTERKVIDERSFGQWSMGLRLGEQHRARNQSATAPLNAPTPPASLAAAILDELTRASG
ncbi:MAG: BLUF domain-containing protein [Proteobacteria bacterium]|nr:BLUF domain-containing protein [Pseudomonadota bacterium]